MADYSFAELDAGFIRERSKYQKTISVAASRSCFHCNLGMSIV